MSQPMEPELPLEGDGIPAADPGLGATPPAEGFGVAAEEPDRAEVHGHQSGTDPVDVPGPAIDTPFRTPDPRRLGDPTE
jgi:hypothetical protein